MHKKYGRYSVYRVGRRKNDIGGGIQLLPEDQGLEVKGVQCISELMFSLCEV
ncbi:hypothetical protein [Holospora curviuscula]|uniref:Uncharacterized protein n=1 Tax=Holospora curviuscula TaxID=1082868 RepID=A0A2S5R8H4_9PROT|nr:hypothetical protein [Holospora curviuscula]PPE03618.1 hypothetical protein HCUR_00928 [Holospora curviuscula]